MISLLKTNIEERINSVLGWLAVHYEVEPDDEEYQGILEYLALGYGQQFLQKRWGKKNASASLVSFLQISNLRNWQRETKENKPFVQRIEWWIRVDKDLAVYERVAETMYLVS